MRKLGSLPFDLLFAGGLALFDLGLRQLWHPLGILSVGIEMAVVGFLLGAGARRG